MGKGQLNPVSQYLYAHTSQGKSYFDENYPGYDYDAWLTKLQGLIPQGHELAAPGAAQNQPAPNVPQTPQFDMSGLEDQYKEMMAKQEEYFKQQQQQAAQQQIDAYLTNRESAYTQAMQDVYDKHAADQARAQMYGLGYKMDDATLQSRVNIAFGNYWSADNDQAMAQIMADYATPEQQSQFASRVRAEDPDKGKSPARVGTQRSYTQTTGGATTQLTGGGVIQDEEERRMTQVLSSLTGRGGF